MRQRYIPPGTESPGRALVDLHSRRSLILPALIGLAIAIGILLGPWSLPHRLVLSACVLAGGVFVAAEYLLPWQKLPGTAYLALPTFGILVIGAAMWASGGATSPFTLFLTLPVVYAVTATGILSGLPVAILAGLVSASPGLYSSKESFVVAASGAVPAFVTLNWLVGVIVTQLRARDRSAALATEARIQSEERAQDLLTLQRVSSIVAQHLSMDDAIASIVRELAAAYGHGLVSLYLFDGEVLTMQAQVGYESFYQTIELNAGAIGTACARGETLFIPDVHQDPTYRPAEREVVSEIAVPIRDEGRVAGVLNVESRQFLSERDRDLMELFGAQVGVVLRNARLAGELRVRAEHDPLTGLLNRGALIEALERSLSTAKMQCAVLVIDLNDFKVINDTHGHPIGDAILAHFADLLRDSCREGDVCSRYGGDEFVVLLPRADRVQAASVAARITSAASMRPCRPNDELEIPISISIGQAVAPEDGSRWKDLLARADQLMYAAKRTIGRVS